MKYTHLYAMVLMLVFCTAYKKQNKTDLPTDTQQSETIDLINCPGLPGMAQNFARFSGEWKLNELKSESIREFPICIFGGGDRMRSRTMKITGNRDFLTIDVASESADGSLVTRQENLTFDGKESEATFVGRPRERSAARWTDDGQTMTVNSVRSFDTNGEKADFKVTEVWKLINDGKSISVQVHSTTISGGVNSMKLVYDKQLAADYRF